MNKITGTIIEAGYHLDEAGTIPGVSIAANAGELHGWDGPLYGRRVVIVDETDYDAREEWIEQLCEQIGRLRDDKRQRVAEGMSRWCKPPDEQVAKAGEVELMTNAARLIREVIGRDLNRRRRFGMYQDQIDDLWKVVDMLEAAAKAGKVAKE